LIMLENAQPKPKPQASIRRANKRVEAKIKRMVRAICVARDGECRICNWEDNPDDWHDDYLNFCDDDPWQRSQWAHLGDKKRFKTRGMPPEERHTTAGSLMLCESAHRAYDAGELEIVALSDRGADGALEFRRT